MGIIGISFFLQTVFLIFIAHFIYKQLKARKLRRIEMEMFNYRLKKNTRRYKDKHKVEK